MLGPEQSHVIIDCSLPYNCYVIPLAVWYFYKLFPKKSDSELVLNNILFLPLALPSEFKK